MSKGMHWLCPATNKDCQRDCLGDLDRPRCILERAMTERERLFQGSIVNHLSYPPAFAVITDLKNIS